MFQSIFESIKSVLRQDRNTEVELETRIKSGSVFQSLEPKYLTVLMPYRVVFMEDLMRSPLVA